MIKLKLNLTMLHILFMYSNDTCVYIRSEIEKFMFRKKSLEYLQLKVQLAEMTILKTKLEILRVKKNDTHPAKLFSFTLPPIHSLLFLTYLEIFLKRIDDQYMSNVLNQQKDIIYQELLTK